MQVAVTLADESALYGRAGDSQARLRELAHPHRILERGAAATDDRSLATTRDRHDIEVERRREAAVERHLLLAVVLPRRQGREVEKAEADRLFDLVRVASSQKHIRDVRFQNADAGASVTEYRRVDERRDKSFLVRPLCCALALHDRRS